MTPPPKQTGYLSLLLLSLLPLPFLLLPLSLITPSIKRFPSPQNLLPYLYTRLHTRFFLTPSLTPPISPSSHFPSTTHAVARKLISIPSVSGDEQAAFAYASDWLRAHGWDIKTMHIPPLKPGGEQRANVLAVRGDIHHVRVVFSTHLDTVPGSGDTQLTHAPGIISGRGAVDAKTQAALLMTVLTSIAAEHRAGTALLFVCGEETDHAGMSAAHGFALPDNITLVNLEPTEGKFVSVTKGMVRGVVRVRGKEMHSGYAHMGVSAINGLLDVLASMRAKWGVQGVDSMNVGVIKGGTAANVVAGYAEAVVLWRVGSSAEGVLGEIEALCAGEGVEFEVKTMNGPVEFFVPGIKGVRVGQVGFNTDVPYYRGLVARKVLWGVGSITVAHTEREYVHMEDIREGERILALLVPELLRSS